jgi:TRAP-type mannitol/chloroaromatic compound transport system substrate-binding protein
VDITVSFPKFSRRGFLKYGSLSGAAAFLTSCLSSNAPTSGATTAPGAGVGAPRAETITLKFQSAFAPQDLFHEMLILWAKKVEELSGGRYKIDALPNNAVVPFTQLIDAVSAGTLDGGLGVPAYWFGKDRSTSLFGTGPAIGMDADMLLGWIHYGGGQALYDDLIQKKLNLRVQSYFFGPMPTQPLGWFKNEVKGAAEFQGLKYRTVGLSADMFSQMGASVQILAGGDIVPALQTGRIDAAEFNNPTSDRLLGFQDVSKILMVQSYHQPMETMEMMFHKPKWDAFSAADKALFRYATMAQSADFTWIFMDRNSKDLEEYKTRFNVKVIKTPKSILEAQLKAWDAIITKESANPDFKKILDSQREWAKRVGTLRAEIMVSQELATEHFFPR